MEREPGRMAAAAAAAATGPGLGLADSDSRDPERCFGVLRLREERGPAAGRREEEEEEEEAGGRGAGAGARPYTPAATQRQRRVDTGGSGRGAPRDPMAIERANLLKMANLSVKGLIESALSFGRTLDSDYAPLQQFFIVMEHCLKHGLKVKKSFLGQNKSLWGPLELVEKLCPEVAEIVTSVRDLPGLKTPLGRARAWLRLAMMQKKLADYLRIIVFRKDLFSEFYEDHAVMMEEEGMVIVGLLVGLNVIDANLCVKGEDLDTMVGVIDFSMYLKGDNDNNGCFESDGQISAILDQKNYVEELNRQLNSTVGSLQGRVSSLETANSKLIEELAIAKNSIIRLQEENLQFRNDNVEMLFTAQKQLELEKQSMSEELEACQGCHPGMDDVYNEAHRQLRAESRLRQDVECDLLVQISMKQEIEIAMKLLEKDIHEKQDALVSLRHQLEEVKAINVEMFKKLKGSEDGLKQKSEMMSQLEEKTHSVTAAMKQIEQRLQQAEREQETAEKGSYKCRHELGGKVELLQRASDQKEQQLIQLETDLKIEKEWRRALQNDLKRERNTISELRAQTQQLSALKKEFLGLQEENGQLQRICNDQEQALQELGYKLSESKLKIETVKEANKALQVIL
ncbi:RUN and FYVE domain-containing protein 2 isoform X1 [Amblyraja radiata]|uniref:RUN and FYVE domain-containing protein 2 isoform X1 n=1 Tax=Amblyraja radiata TaxID=386614 RepID=UPI001403C4C0|nr:RUN and FYVE domain-containing protein 2 isoform X1 [Amblyraja radiata]